MKAVVPLLYRRFIRRWISNAPSSDTFQQLYEEIGALTTSFHDCQKELASAQYTAKINPHSVRVRERAERTQKEMERIHDRFQMLLQRAAHKSVTGAEIVLNGYKQLFQARSWHYNVVMDSHLRHSPGQCEALFRRMEQDKAEPDVEFFNLWLRALGKTRANLDDVHRVLNQMQERGIDSDRYTQSILLEILAQHRQAHLVNETLDAMVKDSIAPTSAALARVLTLYGEMGDVERGDAIRDSLVSAPDRSYSLAIYTSIMRYTLMRGQLDVAEIVWDEMDRAETRPAPDVFDSYISILLDDQRQDLPWSERRHRLRKVLDRAAKSFVRLTLRPLIPVFPKLIPDFVGNRDLLRIMLETVAQSSFEAKIGVQNSLSDWFQATSDLETIQAVMSVMEEVGLSAQSLGHIIVQRCANSQPTLCLRLLQFMSSRGIPIYQESLASIMFASTFRCDLYCCDSVRQLTSDLGMSPTEAMLNAHLNTAIQANATERIDELFTESKERGFTLKPENAQYLLVSSSVRGDLDTCHMLFDMLKCDGLRTPTSLEYDSLIMAIVRSGDPLRAQGLVREMCSQGLSPSCTLLHDVVHAFVQRGLLDDAEHLVQNLPRTRLTDFVATSSNLIILLAQKGELSRCERMCTLLEEAGGFPSMAAMNALIIAFGNLGVLEMSEKLYSLALQQQASPRASVSAHNAFLAVLARNARFDQCCEMLANMQEKSIPIELFAFRQLVSSFAFRSRFDECESTYMQFSSQYNHKLDTVFAWLATPYARSNSLQRLRKFAKQVARSPDQERAFLRSIDEVQRKLKTKVTSK